MTRSMTGFGKAGGELDGTVVAVEMSTVNHRYFDCFCRMPSAWMALESVVKQAVRTRLARGKVNLTVNRKRANSSGQVVRFDPDVAQRYVDASKELVEMLGTYETLSLDTLARLDGVFYSEEPEEDAERVEALLLQLTNQALDQLDTMRRVEGEALEADLRQRLARMGEMLSDVEARLPQLNALYEQRLRNRIQELQTEVAMPEERIAIEVAVLAEKGDVAEEVVRLRTHLDHAADLLNENEPVGRRLDFLSQEIQREINTLGVKTRDADVAKDIIAMKAELEKLREQVQNIE